MRKRFQMLVCAAAFTAAAGLCTLPLTAFAADAAVLLPDESAPVVEVVLEPLTPAAEETEPAEPEEREPAAEPAEPETDLPEAPGIVTLPAEGIVVVPVVDTAPGTDPEPSTEPTDPEEPDTPAETPEAPADPAEPEEPDAPADADADPSDTPDQPTAEPADSGIALLPAKDAETPVVVPTAAEDTVDIDVSWGAMEFTYTAAWNPSTLAYDPGSWTASGNTVTVTNNGTEVTIAQSGLLQPGSALTRLDLDTEVNLPAGSYDGYFSLGFYDPASNEKAPWTSYRRPDHPRFLTPLFFKVFLPAGTAVREFCIHHISARRNFL